MSESKNEGDCAICMEETNYAKCSNPRCHCFLCKEDYDTAAKNTYVAEPAEPDILPVIVAETVNPVNVPTEVMFGCAAVVITAVV